MYLDLFDELRLNKKLVKIAGFEVAAYWAELLFKRFLFDTYKISINIG